MNGVVVIDKPQGKTSHDVVLSLRRILQIKKIGHAGTLDPHATGVLVLCIGPATKKIKFLVNQEKAYEATLQLGVVTDTYDITGRVLEQHDRFEIRPEQFEAACRGFVGEVMQIPPMFSATKVQGQRLYALARRGITVERLPKQVFIRCIDVSEDINAKQEVKIFVRCSKGTYIRTLAHDLGQLLKCGACLKELRRTEVGLFSLGDALTLEAFRQLYMDQRLDQYMQKTEEKLHRITHENLL